MKSYDRLADVFDRGLRDGVESLSPVERELYFIREFILEYEMGGLTSYFYNRLPDLECIQAAVAAMRKHKLTELAALLGEAAGLFAAYTDPDPPSTWKKVLRHYDPAGRLEQLDAKISDLDNFGLCEASFAEASDES